ncbi:MAG: acylphosphatase [Candidatus Omnitrophota bacterium]
MKTYRYTVKGRVQGVAFRYYTVKNATKYHISGTVQNLYNGDVEVHAQGNEENLRQFEGFLHSGPPAGRVEAVVKEELSSSDFYTGFEIV